MIQNFIFGLFSTDMGIDLGTANTLVYVRGKGIVVDEPSVVAVKKGTNQVLLDGRAVGKEAYKMLGRTPGSIEAIRPLKDGVIADFDITKSLLEYFIRRVHDRRWGYRPRVVIAVPYGITEVEKRAVVNSAERAGARQVFLIEEPKAACIGAGLAVEEARGNMIVDIGGGTTEVAVLSLTGIVASESLRVSGDEMDEAIIAHMKEKHGMLIGVRTAEEIKITIGSAARVDEEMKKEFGMLVQERTVKETGNRTGVAAEIDEEKIEKEMDVRGRSLKDKLPRKVSVNSAEIREALLGPIGEIVESIKKVLEDCLPELSADLVDSGMTICGGGALLPGLDYLIAKETGLPVRIAHEPLNCVALGTGRVLEQPELMEILETAAEE